MAIGLKSTFTTWSSAATQEAPCKYVMDTRRTQALKAKATESRLASSSPSELVPQPRFNALRSWSVQSLTLMANAEGQRSGLIELKHHWRLEAEPQDPSGRLRSPWFGFANLLAGFLEAIPGQIAMATDSIYTVKICASDLVFSEKGLSHDTDDTQCP